MIIINNCQVMRTDGLGIYYDFLEEQIVDIIEKELKKRGILADIKIE